MGLETTASPLIKDKVAYIWIFPYCTSWNPYEVVVTGVVHLFLGANLPRVLFVLLNIVHKLAAKYAVAQFYFG